MSNYTQISNFGNNYYSATNNPLSYCIGSSMDQKFLHGSSAASINGQNSKPCQKYMAAYCAQGWDEACEHVSKDRSITFPNNIQNCYVTNSVQTAAGNILVRNTASVKYLKQMLNCEKRYQPFDPNVATSPMLVSWESTCGQGCVPVYSVDPKTIDNDPVMNKILANPSIAPDILVNIKNTMAREGTLGDLEGTKIGTFFKNLN